MACEGIVALRRHLALLLLLLHMGRVDLVGVALLQHMLLLRLVVSRIRAEEGGLRHG